MVAPDTGSTFAFHAAPNPETCPPGTKRGCHKSTTSPLSSPPGRCEWDTSMANKKPNPLNIRSPASAKPQPEPVWQTTLEHQTQDDALEHQPPPDSSSQSSPCFRCASCLSPDRARRPSNQWQRRHSCWPGSPVYKCTRRGYQPSRTARLTLGLTTDSHRAPQTGIPQVPRVGGPVFSLGMEKSRVRPSDPERRRPSFAQVTWEGPR